MSCTNDCGCSPEIRDARTDEWVQIAPESARPATLTGEQVRPARAGMSLEGRTSAPDEFGPPRASGDEPLRLRLRGVAVESAPRERG